MRTFIYGIKDLWSHFVGSKTAALVHWTSGINAVFHKSSRHLIVDTLPRNQAAKFLFKCRSLNTAIQFSISDPLFLSRQSNQALPTLHLFLSSYRHL